MSKRVILWFRSDLRLHDNEALNEAIKHGDEIIPLYVFDERVFKGTTSFGFRKTSRHRAQFIIESVRSLRDAFREKGSELIVRTGLPEEVIYELARNYKTQYVLCNRERTQEEVMVQDALEKKLWTIGQELRYSRGKMLYYTQDLPFPVTHTPDSFTQFRKEVEKIVPIRPPYPVPETFKPPSVLIEPGTIPDLTDFNYTSDNGTPANSFFKGGEKEGLKRLHAYLWENDYLKCYGEPASGLKDGLSSSRLSPWISLGCLSPKLVFRELKRYEAERKNKDKVAAMILELEWRDFLRLMAKKYGNAIFQRGGVIGNINLSQSMDNRLLDMWKTGKTPQPFVNASINELISTGYLNRICRYAAASYLVHDLNLDWRIGASFFESYLLDYDPASNWMNWNYIAGLGPDSKELRLVSIPNLAAKYDPKGVYQAYWGDRRF
jgi:deoxyribodipyrimidine photo-lyase